MDQGASEEDGPRSGFRVAVATESAQSDPDHQSCLWMACQSCASLAGVHSQCRTDHLLFFCSGFLALPRGIATLSDAELGRSLAEPHPSWVPRLEQAWKQRYASGQ